MNNIMKGKLIAILLVLFCVPIFVIAAETCNPDSIKIESIELNDTKGHIEEVTTATGDNNVANLDLKMKVPGDTIEYKLVLNNTSNEDYYFDENSLNIDKDNVNYEITYDGDSNVVAAGQQKTVYLRVSYKDKIETTNLSNGIYNSQSSVVINLSNNKINDNIINPQTGDRIMQYMVIFIASVTLLLVMFRLRRIIKYMVIILAILSVFSITPQTSKALCKCVIEIESKVEIDGKEAMFIEGPEVNVKMKELAGDDTSSKTYPYEYKNTSIKAIKKSDVEPTDTNKEEKNIVSTPESLYPIYMWFDNGTIYWWSEDETPELNDRASCMFCYMNELTDITGLENIDASNATKLAYLLADTDVENVDALEKWNVSNVKSLFSTFNLAASLTDLSGIENWDVSNVTTMKQMFTGCTSLEEIDLSNWETNSLTNMDSMFAMWQENGQGTLEGKIKRIILSDKFDTSKVTSMFALLACDDEIEDYSFLQYIKTDNVENLSQVFVYNNNLKETDIEYIKDWNVSKVKNLTFTFGYTASLASIDGLENWDVSSVESMSSMFRGSAIADVSALKDWNVSNVTTLRHTFLSCYNLEEIDLSNWETDSLTDMNNTFGMWTASGSPTTAGKLKRIIMSDKFNSSQVTDMYAMLANNDEIEDYSFLQYIDTSSVKNMKQLFQANLKLPNLDYLANWDVSNVTDFRNMFYNNTSLTDASAINDWDISPSASFTTMFRYAPAHPNFTKVAGTWSNGTFTPTP